jgi:poly(3-hydroxybutyrate) depolymerase
MTTWPIPSEGSRRVVAGDPGPAFQATLHDAAHDAFMTLPAYTFPREDEASTLGILQYRITGEGHVRPHVTFNRPGGTAVNTFSASALIWAFFQQHPLPGTSR